MINKQLIIEDNSSSIPKSIVETYQLTTKHLNVHIYTTIVHNMTTLLKPGILKILYLFYKQKYAKIHLRELARKTNMYGQSISRHLKTLEKNRIVYSQKVGNLKQYSLMHNQQVYALLSLFDVEKQNKLPLQRKNAIHTYLKALPHPPIFMIVFGSTAKETYSEESDIDLFIITQEKMDARNAENEADALHGMKVSTFQITFEEFKTELTLKEDKVLQSAIMTGYPVLNHIYYYEVVAHERV